MQKTKGTVIPLRRARATTRAAFLPCARFTNHVEARMAVFESIEGWYNPRRRHLALDYQSPINYEWSQPSAA